MCRQFSSRAVRLGDRRLDRNLLRRAVVDHLLAAGKRVAELLDPPGGDDLHARLERLGRELKAALVVPLAGGAVGKGIGPHFAGHLQTDLGDQRPGDRRAQQVDPLVLRLPLQHGKGEVAAQLLAGVDDAGRRCPAVLRLLQDRLAVFARLAEVDVDAVDVVAFILQPAEDDRSIETAGIRENAGRHG